ncbi:CBS domain-containing protein [Thalassobacillus hwangdonensis]|uniref:CBS domain-containing protein n=1 Tax=Thalassobacillus hwangdonensis TaxID=546108 RepID=A0ABW3L580_9BACI
MLEKERAERFERIFNQIHQRLKQMNEFPSKDAFIHLLHTSRDRNSAVRFHFHKLKQYAKLRNALVHERIKDDYYVAIPHQEVVEDLEHIHQTLVDPPQAMALATSPVIHFQPASPIRAVLKFFSEQKVSQFPVYRERNFVGLLTEGGIIKWMANNMQHDLVSLEAVTVEDVLKMEPAHNVEFLPITSTIFELEELFETFSDKNQKLEAVILTESGMRDQKPAGIVTSWDLIEIDHTTLTLTSQS